MTVSFRLQAPARVVFVVRGPSPYCGVAAKKVARGRRGTNTVRLTRRFHGRALQPGTYRIVVILERGSHRVRIGRISVQVASGRSLRRVSGPTPAFHCGATYSGGGKLSGLSGAPPSGLRFDPPAPREPSRSGVLAVPPLHLDGGSGSALSRGLLALIFYATLGLAGSGLFIWALRH